MASIWDFDNATRVKLEEIFAVVHDRRGFCSQFDKNTIMTLYKAHGFDKTHFTIERAMANDWLKPDRWNALMELVAQYGMANVALAIVDMNKLENHSIATVEGLLNGSIPRKRKNPNAKSEVTRPLPDRPYPPANNMYRQGEAQRWLLEKGHTGDRATEFFENGGRDADGNQLYLLKGEYR